MQTVNPFSTPEQSLAELYPEQAQKMYAACEAGAAKHTGPDSLFGVLPTNIVAYPLQTVDRQFVPADGLPIEDVVEFGNLLSPGIAEQSKPFIEKKMNSK